MIKQTVNLKIDEAYRLLKTSLIQKGCKIISEDAPTHLLAKQGSLWGLSPVSAKKNLELSLSSGESGTEITCSSRLSSDWKNLTAVGCALAAVLAAICAWMVLDIDAFITTGKVTFWSWIANVNGAVDVSVASAFANLAKTLAVFLTVVIAVEIAVAVYAYKRIDTFGQESLAELSKK